MYVPSRQYDSQNGTKFYDYSNDSPYDNFMRKHLQHYGYYTGKNDKRIKNLESWQGPEPQPNYKEYGCEDDYMNEALKTNERQEKELSSNQVVYNVNDGKVVTKLKEPRALFSIAPDPGFHPPKWPIELEVLPERVTHIDDFPGPEPFNHPTGFEPCPTILGEEGGGRLVFVYEPVLSPFFIKSRVGGSKTLSDCQVRLESETDDTLMFESRFECGNLRKVCQVAPTEYELWLRTDLYTSKHTQWFYFRVSNTRPGLMYRFTLVNFYKSASLYNEGLRPLMYSEKSASSKGIGWRRCGGNIKYFRSNKRYSTSSGDRFYYSLTWQIRFEHAEDTVYFAHCYPYTYSDLVDYLQKLQDDPVKSQFCKQRVLCRSLAGNAVHLLTIGTSAEPPPMAQQQQYDHADPESLGTTSGGQGQTAAGPGPGKSAASSKKVILVTSRVHPGESNASWMMKGFLDFLTGDSAEAKLLRDCFTFKVVPMINPDGVIVGNYRCSLTGRDLNRNYKSVLKDSFPAVHAIVELVKKLQTTREVALYCDLHGHSRRQNVFIYGCEDKDAKDNKDRLLERLFPAMVSKNSPDKFSYEFCKFKMQKSKDGTGRIVMYNLGVSNAYTMEATFCGSTVGALKGNHFHCRHLEQMGAEFCDTLLDYFDPSPTKRENMLLQVEHKLKAQILVYLQRSGRGTSVVNVDELSLSEISDDDLESSDGGSDSSASNGLPVHYEFMKSQISQERKKKRRSRKERGAAAASKKPQKPPHADCVPTGEVSQLDKRSMCPHNGAAAAAGKPSRCNAKPQSTQSAPAKTSTATPASASATVPSAEAAGGGTASGAALASRSASSMAGTPATPAQAKHRGLLVHGEKGQPARLKSVASDPNMQPQGAGVSSPDKDPSQSASAEAGAKSAVKQPHHHLADFDRIAGLQLMPTGRYFPAEASNLLRIYSYQRTNAVANNYTLETIEYLLAARESEQRHSEGAQQAQNAANEELTANYRLSTHNQQHLLQRRSASSNQIGSNSSVSVAQTPGLSGVQLEPLPTATVGSRGPASQKLRDFRLRRHQLPNRRMHSASPSYPAHSVPVQIAPEERHAYQLEWSLSQQQQQNYQSTGNYPPDAAAIQAIDNSEFRNTGASAKPPLSSTSTASGGQHSQQGQRRTGGIDLGRQHEIAQTTSHPTVALSSSSKPPLPNPSGSGLVLTGLNQFSPQTRPAMINLHMASSLASQNQSPGGGSGAQMSMANRRRTSLPTRPSSQGQLK